MILAEDKELIDKNNLIKGLAVLLDPQQFQSRLDKSLGKIINQTEIFYIRHKSQRNCLIGYRIFVDGQWQYVYAKAYRDDEREKILKAHQRLQQGRFNIIWNDVSIIVNPFPDDNKIKALRWLFEKGQFSRRLKEVMGDQEVFQSPSIEALRYKPERRYVGKICDLDSNHQAVIKAYTISGFKQAQKNAQIFSFQPTIKTPGLIANFEQKQMLVFDWIHAKKFNDILPDSAELRKKMQRSGQVLRAIHDCPEQGLQAVTIKEQVLNLFAIASSIGEICPSLQSLALELAGKLSIELDRLDETFCCSHGDFYADQLLFDHEDVWILDFDRACLAHPAMDYGRFLAHLDNKLIHNELSLAQMQMIQEELKQGYGATGRRNFNHEVYLFRSAALFNLAMESFRRHSHDWPQKLQAVLLRIQEFSEIDVAHKKDRIQSTQTIIQDEFNVTADLQMKYMKDALTPQLVESEIKEIFFQTNQFPGLETDFSLKSVEVFRYKPSRRCLLQYDFYSPQSNSSFSFIGKVRAKGINLENFDFQKKLHTIYFSSDSADNISMPEPIGTIPHWHMTLYQKIPGKIFTDLLINGFAEPHSRKIALAAYKLHSSVLPLKKEHSFQDELDILYERLNQVVESFPNWSQRINALLAGVNLLADMMEEINPVGIHRDFYSDQVLIDGDRLYLVDFDLCCLGDPNLDIGNFLAHITEMAVRLKNNPKAFVEIEESILETAISLANMYRLDNIRIYKLLTMLRHIFISTQIQGRAVSTERILEWCEIEMKEILKNKKS